jgi:GNAT superfamily N-acetyltransferase
LADGSDVPGQVTVRPAVASDAERIAALATQLGFPSTAKQVLSRLAHVLHDSEDAVYVAELADGLVIGWVHILVIHGVVNDTEAEVDALVIDQAYQGCGGGTLLMEHAEQWARAKGLPSIYLRSNVLRKEAHAFYEKLGYKVVKTQLALRKTF